MAREKDPESVEAIAQRLRWIRIAFSAAQGLHRPMSQAEFARQAKIGVAAWNNAETGDNRIGIDNAIALCRLTGVSLDYIYRAYGDRLPHKLAVEITRLEAERFAKRA